MSLIKQLITSFVLLISFTTIAAQDIPFVQCNTCSTDEDYVKAATDLHPPNQTSYYVYVVNMSQNQLKKVKVEFVPVGTTGKNYGKRGRIDLIEHQVLMQFSEVVELKIEIENMLNNLDVPKEVVPSARSFVTTAYAINDLGDYLLDNWRIQNQVARYVEKTKAVMDNTYYPESLYVFNLNDGSTAYLKIKAIISTGTQLHNVFWEFDHGFDAKKNRIVRS